MPLDIKKFKSNAYAPQWYSRALFLETYYTSNPDKSAVLYTLGPVDRDGYPSLHRLYLELGDLTEYKFANEYLGGWDHWQHLCECEWFKPYLAKWRTELELKLQAEALIRIREEAEMDGRNAFQANRFLVSRGWISKEAEESRRGRPSKAEVRKIAAAEAQKISKVEEDLKRIQELN